MSTGNVDTLDSLCDEYTAWLKANNQRPHCALEKLMYERDNLTAEQVAWLEDFNWRWSQAEEREREHA